jgi:hypothetical protein
MKKKLKTILFMIVVILVLIGLFGSPNAAPTVPASPITSSDVHKLTPAEREGICTAMHKLHVSNTDITDCTDPNTIPDPVSS